MMTGAPNLIRGGRHSVYVAAQELARAGLLDVVSSDNVPSALLSSALMLGDLRGGIARGAATVSGAPAEAVGLTDRGHLVPGAQADVIRDARVGAAGALRGVWSQVARVG